MTANHSFQSITFPERVVLTPHTVTHPQMSRYRQRLKQIITSFAGKRILVVGDMIADEYLIGAATRLSREAPIPIIQQKDRYIVPGGAMNPAVNACTLGAEVYVAGIVGDDQTGERLRLRLRELGINLDLLFSEPGRPTSCKLRVLASNNQGIVQHVARIDTIDTTPIAEPTMIRIMHALEDVIPTVDGIILSDYDNGFMGLSIIDTALAVSQRHQLVVVADAHGELERFQNVTAITPNQPEAELATGIRIHDMDSLEKAGKSLARLTGAQSVLITRGSEGMSLFEQENNPVHIPVRAVDARDTTGAGDTVAATFALALTSGATTSDAATLANIAASLVVQHLGCATNTANELLQVVLDTEA
jgi:rfaE bifunctional protein kinase chain/domain